MWEAYRKTGKHRTKLYIIKNMGAGFFKCLIPRFNTNGYRKKDIYKNELCDKNGQPLTDDFLSKIRKVKWET